MAPRYSIIPGRLPDDARATIVHFRVITALGRRTNRAGWCFVSQTKLAGHLGFGRQAINQAIRDLVEWGYIEKQSQAETHRAICRYRVVLDGGSADDPDVDDGTGDVSPMDDTSHGGDVSPVGDRGVSSTDDTRVALETTRGVAYRTTPRTTAPGERPPTHNDAREARGACAKIIDDLKAGNDSAAAASVVDLLIAPLIGVLRPPAGASLPDVLAAIRDDCAEFDFDTLEAAKAAIRRSRTVWPSPAKVREACVAARAEIALAKRTTIRVGTPEWIAWDRWWVVHEKTSPGSRDHVGVWIVPAPLPPIRYTDEAWADFLAKRHAKRMGGTP